MGLTQKKYLVTLILQYLCIVFDIFVNSFSSFTRQNQSNLLVLFVIQDFCLIISLTILLANFFSTYVFQAGLIQLLYTQFRLTLLICIAYITLSISLHSWHMTVHWNAPLIYFWPLEYHSLFIIHKSVALLYYYLSKKASLQISDPKFHEGSIWMQNQINL